MPYPSEAWPVDGQVALLDGSTDLLTGLPYIPKGTGPASTPPYEVQFNRREQRLNSILAGWRQGMVVDEGGLHVGVYPIEYTLGGLRRSFGGATGVAVPDNALRVVYLNSDGALQIAETWPASIPSFLPLATVEACGGVLSIVDRRVYTVFQVPQVDGSARDRRLISAYRASVGGNESGTEIHEFDPAEALTVEEVQVYCSAVSPTATVDVKVSGSSILSSPATPLAATVVKPTVANGSLPPGGNLTVHVTTSSGGGISNLAVTVLVNGLLAG